MLQSYRIYVYAIYKKENSFVLLEFARFGCFLKRSILMLLNAG